MSVSVKFDEASVTPIQEIGNLPEGWHCAPPKSGLKSDVDVVRKGAVTVVIAKKPSSFVSSPEYIVTTYWDADPTQVLATVRGDRELHDLDGEWSWCGGGMTLGAPSIIIYLGSLKTAAKVNTGNPAIRTADEK